MFTLGEIKTNIKYVNIYIYKCAFMNGSLSLVLLKLTYVYLHSE